MTTTATPKAHHKARKVIDIANGKTYDSVVEAAKEIGCSTSHLANQLNGNVTNKTTLKYLDTNI